VEGAAGGGGGGGGRQRARPGSHAGSGAAWRGRARGGMAASGERGAALGGSFEMAPVKKNHEERTCGMKGGRRHELGRRPPATSSSTSAKEAPCNTLILGV
jgi:hypothetical protein